MRPPRRPDRLGWQAGGPDRQSRIPRREQDAVRRASGRAGGRTPPADTEAGADRIAQYFRRQTGRHTPVQDARALAASSNSTFSRRCYPLMRREEGMNYDLIYL